MKIAIGSSGRSHTDINALLAGALENSRWPIALIGPDLALIWCNRAAREEFRSGLSFSLAKGRLTLRNEAQDERFRQFLTKCDGEDRSFTHPCSKHEPVLARCRTVRRDTVETVYCVSFFRPSEKPQSVEPPIGALFGLTAMEERVLWMLRDGSTAECVSEELDVSIATVRKHISNAYTKIGVRSREELFARLRLYS